MLDNRVIHGNLTLVTAPPVLLTVTEAKAQSRVLVSEEDGLIESMIAAATALLDGRDGILIRALLTQTWDYALPCFPIDRWIALPLAPVQSIVSIKYRDASGTLQTFSSANYQLSSDRHWNPKVHLAVNASWPGTQDVPDAVTIQAIYGYTAVPAPIGQAILLLVAHWFENREAVNMGNIGNELPFGVDALLEPYKRAAF